jgi:methionine aminotransferase
MPAVQIKSKLPGLPVSIFTHMTQMAMAHQAINLGQGFPDFPMDPLLQDLVYKAMKDGFNQYAHSNGFPLLREVIANKINALYQNPVSWEHEITITPGGTYAISNALTSILQEGDEVILFEPCFDSYIPNIEVMGARPVPIPLDFPSYAIPWEKVRLAINPKTRMILLNSPNNPTGTIFTKSDLETLKDLVRHTNIFIMSDEVYEHLVFDGQKHLSILSDPELFERSFVAFSLGKVFHCTGWKMGYSVAPTYLMKEFRNHHQFNVFSSNSVMQVGMATYLQNPEVYLSLPALFQEKRDFFLAKLKTDFLKPLACYGSYFQCFTFDKSIGLSDFELAEKITQSFGVATIPVSAFYREKTDNGVLRICFAKKEETLLMAAERLNKADYSKLK